MKYPLFAAGMMSVLGWIIIAHYPPLLYYWFALMLVVSIINFVPGYKPYRTMSNLFFLAYICFITWVRTRQYKFSHSVEFWINNAEHMIFALVVCLLAALYLRVVFSVKASFGKTLLYTIIAFNLVGIVNEYFQNMINHRTIFLLTADSQKDLLMNIGGTIIFVLLAAFYHYNKHRFGSKANA